MELSQTQLIEIRENAQRDILPDADTVIRLVEQARQLDFVSTSIMFQRLFDVNELLKRLMTAADKASQQPKEDPSVLQRSIKRCSTHIDELQGACVRYRRGWPSAHVKW